jgi:hypothetical protein
MIKLNPERIEEIECANILTITIQNPQTGKEVSCTFKPKIDKYHDVKWHAENDVALLLILGLQKSGWEYKDDWTDLQQALKAYEQRIYEQIALAESAHNLGLR